MLNYGGGNGSVCRLQASFVIRQCSNIGSTAIYTLTYNNAIWQNYNEEMYLEMWLIII